MLFLGGRQNERDACLGAQVVRVRLSADREVLVFDLADGRQLGAATFGDCCSETYIQHLGGVAALLRYPITGFRDDPLPDEFNTEMPLGAQWPQEYERRYGLTILTAGGACTVDYRNYSNGYYGGGLVPTRDTTECRGQPITWRDITEDV